MKTVALDIVVAVTLIALGALTARPAQAQPKQTPPAKATPVPFSTGTVRANGITIAYESRGATDRECVLLIMGNGAQLTAWPVMSVEGGKDTASNIPGAELLIIPGMGHDLAIPLVKTIADAITAAAVRATGPPKSAK